MKKEYQRLNTYNVDQIPCPACGHVGEMDYFDACTLWSCAHCGEDSDDAPRLAYDYKTDSMGGVTITRLSDGATCYLQFSQDIETLGPLDKLDTPQGQALLSEYFTE